MKKIVAITFLAVVFIACKSKRSIFEGRLVSKLELKPIKVCISLPSYKIIDTSNGFDRTEIYGVNLSAANINDSINALFVIRDYSFPELRGMANNLGLAKERAVSHIETLLKEKDIIYDTVVERSGYKIGYLKYFIDEYKTNYVKITGKKFYKSTLYFFKEDKLVTISIEEKFQDKKFDRYSLTDYIIDKIEYNCSK